MNDQKQTLPTTTSSESRPQRDHMPRYFLASALAVIVLFDLLSLLAGPTHPAWLAAVVLIGPTVGIPAGIAAFRHRNSSSYGGPAGAAAPHPAGSRR